jgi:hypothetical protein
MLLQSERSLALARKVGNRKTWREQRRMPPRSSQRDIKTRFCGFQALMGEIADGSVAAASWTASRTAARDGRAVR